MAVDPIRNAGGPHLRAVGMQTHTLFERHSRMVYGLCRTLLRDPDDADDATQATFIAAYQSLLAGNRVREPAAWLATIARNECAARSRNRMREPLPLPDADLVQVQGPDAELERVAVVAELRQAIAGLPEKQREAVVLRDLYGLPYTEVGAALGISLASVESLLFRARRSLRVSLKTLAGGALTVPLAVREGVAQALPALGAGGGGAASGAVGIGLIAKIASGPATLKAAAGLAAALAAGSIAVAGVEHGGTARPKHPPTRVAAQATPAVPPTHPALVAAAPVVATPSADSVNQGSFGHRNDSSSDTSGGHDRSGHGDSSSGGSGETTASSSGQQRDGGDDSGHGVVTAPFLKKDSGESTQGPSSSSGTSGGRTGEQTSSGGHASDGGDVSSSGPGSGDDSSGQRGSAETSGTSGMSGDASTTQTESSGSGSSGGSGGSGESGDTSGGGSGDSGGLRGGDGGQASGGDDTRSSHDDESPSVPA